MRTRRWIGHGTAFGMALVFSLLMMTANSPLFRTYGSDSAIFVTIGRAVAGGAVPYRDIFDHKGPVIFYINALAQAVWPSTASVWVLEMLCLYASLLALQRIAGALQAKPVWLIQLAYLALVGLRLDGGNYTEEYCNLFTLLALAWGLELAQPAGAAKPAASGWRRALGIGAMFGLCAMTRLNNAMPAAGMALALLAWLFCARRPVFWRAAGWMAAGAALSAAPFLLYLWAADALSDFVYGAFIHNMMYAAVPRYSRWAMLISTYGYYAALCCAGALAGAALAWKRARGQPGVRAWLAALVCAAALAWASTMLSHKGYAHYLLVCAPAAAAGLAAALSAPDPAFRSPKPPPERLRRARPVMLGAVALAACCTLLLYGGFHIRQAGALLAEYPGYDEACQDLAAHIPAQERGDVLGYRVEPKWYVASGIVPGRRIFFMQEILAQVDPALMDELIGMFDHDPPRWLALPASLDITPPVDPRVLERIEARYERVAINEYNALLRLAR